MIKLDCVKNQIHKDPNKMAQVKDSFQSNWGAIWTPIWFRVRREVDDSELPLVELLKNTIGIN